MSQPVASDKIIQILPTTDFKGLDEIIALQDAYYGRQTVEQVQIRNTMFGRNPRHIVKDEI